ncbi:MAG: hypothetical protein IKX78_03875, partial [Clostridia bacterium]|nr:hypothetical protein [Clostridia bacterium]
FERRNGKKDWVSGLSSWSNTGSRDDVAFVADGKNHYATVTGNTRLYEGLYVKKSSAMLSFDAKCKGEAYLFAADENGGLMFEEKIAESDEFGKVSYTASLNAGTYYFGVRTVEGAELSVDNFKLTTGSYDGQNAKQPGEIISELSYDYTVFADNKGKAPILNERFTVKTEPQEIKDEPAETEEQTETEQITTETAETDMQTDKQTEEETKPADDGKENKKFPIIPVVAAVAAAAAVVTAAVVIIKKKKK